MTKRSTIGINPLDEAIPNPLEATIPDQPEGKEQSTHQEEKKQKDVDSSSSERPASTPVFHTKDVSTQNLSVSQENGPKEESKIHQEDVAQPSQPEAEVLPSSGQLAERVSELEQENLCLKWALGLILAPLALLALLG